MAKAKKKIDSADKTEVADSDTLNLRLEEAKTASPVLVIISGRPLGKSFFLTKTESILGRDLAADISLQETAISRKHTSIQIKEDGSTVLKDLGSTNGTFVNDQKVDTHDLEDGDLIRVGNTIMKFLEEGQIENLHYNKMYDLATRDDLTGTVNKKTLLEVVAEEFHRGRQAHSAMSLMFFDLDHFKKTNDTFGHPAGDYVLKETCSLIMSKMIRAQDVLGRYGGEEFALVLKDTPLKVAIEVAERIRSMIEAHNFVFEGKKIPVTISVGVVTLDSTAKNPEDMIALADKALYEAKNSGRNKVCVR